MAVAAKVRGRVRTQWLALGAALVVLAGVLVAWAVGQAAERVQVVRVTSTVHAGDPIEAGDLAVTGVAFDAQVEGLVPAASLDAVVGRVAAIDLQPGALLQAGMWRDDSGLAPGEYAVGAVLAAGRFPAGLGSDDLAIAAGLDTADPAVLVRVVEARPTDDGSLAVTLAVAATDSVVVARLAAGDRLVLVGAEGGDGA